MVKRTLSLLALTVAAVSASAHSPGLLGLAFTGASFSTPNTPVVEPGRLYIKIKLGRESAANTALRSIGATVKASFPKIGWKSVTFPTSLAVAAAQAKLAANTSFAKVEPSYKRYFLETPNDPRVGNQWSLPVLHLNEAWGVTHGDTGVTVCVIDSGFDTGHPDYAGVLLTGKNFGDGDAADLTDIVGHGTHVAGTVGAATNNGIGIAGNAYGSKILPYKVATSDGGVSHDGLINAIIAAGDAGAPIASISIGGYGLDTVEQDAINYSSGKGTLFIVAAGNSDTNIKSYPAAFEACVAVGATDRGNVKADFSNYGDWVDVAAPGVDILSLYPRDMSGTGYEYLSGTSMACPNTSGVASLILAAAGPGNLTSAQLRNILENTCTPLAGGWVQKGLVNAYKAVLATPSPVTETPTPTTLVPVEGTISDTDSSTVTTVDGISTTITSVKKTGVGLTGAMSTSFGMGSLTIADLRSAILSFNANGDRLGLYQVYFKNAANKWVLVKTLPGNQTTATIQMGGAAIAPYMTTGELNVMVRAYVPTRLANQSRGVTQIDQLQLVLTGRRTRASVTP